MALFLDSKGYNGVIPKIVELQDNYLINGQVYTKDYVPQALTFCPLNGYGKTIMLNEVILPKCLNGTSNVVRNACVTDFDDPEKQYYLCDGYDAKSPSIINFNVKNGKVENLFSKAWTSPTRDTQEYLCQDSTYIFSLITRVYNGYSAYIVRYKKDGTEVKDCNFGSWPSIRMLGQTNNDIYFATSTTNDDFKIERFSKKDMTRSTILNDAFNEKTGAASLVEISLYPTEINSDNEFYAIRSIRSLDKEEKIDKIIIKKYNFNPITEEAKEQVMEIDYNGFEQIIKSDNNQSYKWEFFEHSCENKKYLTMFSINANNNNTTIKTDNFMCTFEIIDDKKIKCIYKKDLGTTQYRGIIKMFENSSFIAASESIVEFYTWSEINKRFEKTSQFVGDIHAVGLDKSFNVYIQKEDNTIELLAKTLPIRIEADFEKDKYNYNNKDIGTYIYIKAYNYLNKFLTYNFEVNLAGPVKFTDTGLKKKIVATLDSGELKIPVTVYGKGVLEINLKEKN